MNFYPSPQSSPLLLKEPVDWTYSMSNAIYWNKKSLGLDSPLPSLQVWSGSLTIHIEHSSRTQSRILFERELTWALSSKGICRCRRSDSRERDVSKRRRISSELPSLSSAPSPPRHLSPPPIPRWHRGVPGRFGYQHPSLHTVDQNTLDFSSESVISIPAAIMFQLAAISFFTTVLFSFATVSPALVFLLMLLIFCRHLSSPPLPQLGS